MSRSEPSPSPVPNGIKEEAEKNLSPKTAPARHQGAAWRIKEPDGPWDAGLPIAQLSALAEHSYLHELQRTAKGPDGWSVVAGTRRGRMHANEGTHREDAFDFVIGDGMAVYAVCDGAGSSRFSRIGSEFTARRAVNEVLRRLAEAEVAWRKNPNDKPAGIETIVRETTAMICEELQDFARKVAAEPKDFRCTFLLLIQLSDSAGEEFWASQVGDGFIGEERADGAARWGASDSGDFSGEVGCFIPDSEAAAQALRTLTRHEGAALLGVALASDGIEDPFFPIPKHLGTIFGQLRQGVATPLDDFTYPALPGPVAILPPDTAELAKWLAFEKRGENDDRTILMIYRTAHR